MRRLGPLQTHFMYNKSESVRLVWLETLCVLTFSIKNLWTLRTLIHLQKWFLHTHFPVNPLKNQTIVIVTFPRLVSWKESTWKALKGLRCLILHEDSTASAPGRGHTTDGAPGRDVTLPHILNHHADKTLPWRRKKKHI